MPANLRNGNAGRVTATEAAHRAIAALRAAHGGPVMFVQPPERGDGAGPDGGGLTGGQRARADSAAVCSRTCWGLR